VAERRCGAEAGFGGDVLDGEARLLEKLLCPGDALTDEPLVGCVADLLDSVDKIQDALRHLECGAQLGKIVVSLA
jgi:hypothetical protein